jgi:monofunctional biosynthetic peptidoglycan transglycosylase
MARAKNKAGKGKGSRRNPLRRLIGWLFYWPLRLFAYGLAGAILWVGAYTLINPPGGVYMATERVRLGGIQRDWRDLEDISPDLARAVMAAEDANFCDHWGLDLKAIEKAFTANAKGHRVRGASTISQQVAKNVFLWHGRSWLRKGMELGFTVLIETIWTKRRTIEVYLNVAEFGDGIFGAQSAAPAWREPDSDAARRSAHGRVPPSPRAPARSDRPHRRSRRRRRSRSPPAPRSDSGRPSATRCEPADPCCGCPDSRARAQTRSRGRPRGPRC